VPICRARVAAQGRKIEAEAAQIPMWRRWLAQMRTASGAIQWLIALMVQCCGPLAIAPTPAASRWRSITSKTAFGP
jgi:hypothetical protein